MITQLSQFKIQIKSVSVIVVTAFIGMGCGKATSTNARFGQYGSNVCFLNKLASQGFGQNIYTIATMSFRADGTGTSTYRLFDDSDCLNELAAGQQETSYEFQVSDGGTVLVQIDQYDPADPSVVTRFWIPGFEADGGIYLDVDYADGEAGPYLAVPSSPEIADFVTSPETEGVFFSRN